MYKNLKVALTVTAMAGAFVAAAPANATVSSSFIQGGTAASQPGLVLLTDFQSDPGLVGTPGTYMIHGPTSDGLGAVPAFGSTGNYLSVLGGGDAYLALPSNVVSFAFDWGSLDSYNTLTVYGIGGQFGAGSSITFIPGVFPSNTAANGNQQIANTNGALFLTGDAGERFTGLKFQSGSNSFEVDNLYVNAPVPEPATWAMMIAGFGLIGASMRRRSAQSAVTFA